MSITRQRRWRNRSTCRPWQLVDAVNQVFAGQSIPDFVAAPGLIDKSNVPSSGAVFDPESGYRDIYKSVWGK
jgi:ribose transport system substrate-binding protein